MNTTKALIILRSGGMLLVEWTDDHKRICRAWVTPDMVESEDRGFAYVYEPGRGLPYGVDWSAVIELSATPEDIDRELKRRGIWTHADLLADPNGAVAAIQTVYRFDLARLLQVAKQLSTEVEK